MKTVRENQYTIKTGSTNRRVKFLTQIYNIGCKIIPYNSALYRLCMRIGIYLSIRWRLKKRNLLEFAVLLCEHCNLNCARCVCYSPLAPERFLDLADYERDLQRLAYLFNGTMDYIELLGGEPLLHPRVTEIITVTRKYFPRGLIRIVTNGLLLLKQPPEFWKSCQENNAIVVISKYPIKLDIESIRAQAGSYGVNLSYHWGEDVPVRSFWQRHLDITGKQNAVDSFNHCLLANNCTHLRDGKIYVCAVAACIEFLNNAFGLNFTLDAADSIDIHKTDNPDDILQFMCTPKPFCRYCKTRETTYGVEWAVSKKQIEEWL